jgi:serine/threonine-protein kinase
MSNEGNVANLIGQTLGQYKIVSLLGSGGMAAVYRAHQESIARDVAIKVIRPQLSELESFILRFRGEAKLVASLSHPHIVKVFDYGQYEDMAYLVMELLSGGSLAQLIRQGPLSLERTGKMLDQVASALDFAHENGIIHRDLKPQNVLLDANQNAFLTDFGIAKIVEDTAHLTQSGTVMGTPAYMSPEQWSGQQIDSRADIYALGIMLFEMLTGKLPFNGNTPYLLMHQHIYETPRSVSEVNANVPPAIAVVVNQALAKDREARYNKASELATAFRAAIADSPVPITRIKSPTKPMLASSANLSDKTFVVTKPTDGPPATIITPPVTAPNAVPARSSSRSLLFIGSGALVVIVIIGALLAIMGKGQTSTPTPLAQTTIAPTAIAVIVSPAATSAATQVVIASIPTSTMTNTPTLTLTLTETLTPTITPSLTVTVSPTLTPSLTSTVDAEGTLNAVVQLTVTGIAQQTELAAAVAVRLTETEQAKPTTTFTPSKTATKTQTPTNNPTLTLTPTETLTPSDTWTPEPTSTDAPTLTPSTVPTATATPPISVGLATIAFEFGSSGTGSGFFQDLRYVSVDGNGNIYTGEYTSGRIQKFDATGKFITSWIPPTTLPLRGLAADRSGNVYAVRQNKVFKFDGTGKLLKTFSNDLSSYDDVVVLPDGNLIVSDTDAANDDIVKLNATTGVEMQRFKKAISGQTNNPELDMRLAVDGLGTIYALGSFNRAVFVFNATGKFKTQFGEFEAPDAITVDGQSNVYVTDFGGIKVFDKKGAALGSISLPNHQAFQAVINDKGELFVAARDRVYKLALSVK